MANKFTPAYPQNREPHLESPFGARWFMIDQLIKRISTATLVQVGSVTTNGALAPIGQLDATPLVNMIDGANNASAHGPVRSLCYFRLQAGKKAVIMDPKAGDIGLAVICDRDIQAVKTNLKASQPASRRRFDLADGVYLGTVLSKDTPTSYLQFADDGTVILGVGSGANPLEVVVGSTWVQMKQKNVSDMHITIDTITGLITSGKTIGIGPDPHPEY